ncbi:hypothetical protein MMC12_000708 [Toensbergia leucococca]|nr:hypothetical protein [Toensbergia leucococca]
MECMRDAFQEDLLLDGRYQSVSPLNHGSFGMVFLAKDINSGDLVAVKCLTKSSPKACPTTPAEDHSVELSCHDRLGFHPNIVNLLHSFETDAHIYLVLEFCSMGDLYEAIRLGHGPRETENVREFMLQLINAVDFMHSKGLYHRDIKPENIFLAQDGSLKLGDFGLATSESWSHEASVGSDRYMAPEQYDPSESGYSPAKADTWAIGICLLNILFSRNPFVTPTESDVLFADFARDNQSLFDIFPTMSQDTFEVLGHAMALDPTKRSLEAFRDTLLRVVSFTTDDEALDDFRTEDREIVPPTANREPLRTPSIQSAQVDQGGAFPWARALHMSPPQKGRQLSAIPDTESYTEDLFPNSEKDRNSWYSVAAPSMTSVWDSALGASVKSLNLREPEPRKLPRSGHVATSDFQPIHASKPLPAMSTIFGRKDDSVSKSWSDLWDEDEEESLTQEEVIEQRREYNSRSWSQESKDSDPTIRRNGLSELKGSSIVNTRTQSPQDPESRVSMDGVNENDGFFFEDLSVSRRYSPPSKRVDMDKWAALGNRRRAYHQSVSDSPEPVRKRSNNGNWRSGLGLKAWSGNTGGWDKKDIVSAKVRDWRREDHPAQQRDDEADAEWVGGWHDLHL